VLCRRALLLLLLLLMAVCKFRCGCMLALIETLRVKALMRWWSSRWWLLLLLLLLPSCGLWA
jgi:hypothetical protein